MSWTKREIINQALSEIGLSNGITASELQDAMRVLDGMMGVWSKKGIVFATVYPLPTVVGGGDIDDATNAPVEAVEAMYLNLAVRLGSGYGKVPSPDTKSRAVIGFNDLLGGYVKSPERTYEGMVQGAGHKTPLSPFIGS